MPARTVRKVESVGPGEAPDNFGPLADLGSLISGLCDVVQEQIDEYTSLLEDVVEKATGRSLWAPCDLATAGGDYETLNRKSGAISYLLVMIGEKAEALETRARTLSTTPTVPTVRTAARQPRARTSKRRAA